MNHSTTVLAILATAVMAGAQAQFVSSATLPRTNGVAPRRLNPWSAVCVSPVLNLAGPKREELDATHELVEGIRQAGFISGPLGTLDICDAIVFTEIVRSGGRNRKRAEVEFRILLSGEQIPRLCSSARGKSIRRKQDAVLAALADEARQIRGAQTKGMPIYRGSVD